MTAEQEVAWETSRVDQLLQMAARILNAEVRRSDDMRALDNSYRKEIAELESKRIDANALAESRRIDAVTAGDRANVVLANTRAEAMAASLATQQDSTAKAVATQLEGVVKNFNDRLDPVTRAIYEGAAMKQQTAEARIETHWTTERVLQLLAIVAGLVYFIASR